MSEHPPTPPPENEYSAFRRLLQQVVSVPKSRIDQLIAEEKARRAALSSRTEDKKPPMTEP